jgi:hypothetical protein
MNADDAWKEFCDFDDDGENGFDSMIKAANDAKIVQRDEAPECSPIYISTKTKIGYLNQCIPLEDMFWAIDVLPSYATPCVGIVKKEMKFKTVSEDALAVLVNRIENIPKGPYVQQSVKTHMEADNSMKFKDIRKVSVGLCKKQMTSFRSKVKGAFFNCFAIILRLEWEGQFKEMHIKVFNTGKLEIPGIPGVNTDKFMDAVLSCLVKCLTPISEKLGLDTPIDYRRDYNETVLTNSNFTANYLVDRERLTHILRQQYRILTTYDPCSYPGVQSKFYYVASRAIQDGRPLSEIELQNEEKHIVVPVMIFRTGSVLIVGKFDDDVLLWVYDFIKNVLKEQYNNVQVGRQIEEPVVNVQPRKNKKRFININV